jgi:hypothetical protein
MLQISTGKFFDTKDTHDTIHRGVLYSNFHMLSGDCIKTQSGNLSPAARWGDIETFACEVIERQPNVFAAGAILSVGPDVFIHYFAAVRESLCPQIRGAIPRTSLLRCRHTSRERFAQPAYREALHRPWRKRV